MNANKTAEILKSGETLITPVFMGKKKKHN